MNLVCTSRALHPRHAFRISRGRRTEVRNVFVRLESDGVIGYGEASPNAFYGETWEGVTARLEGARDFLARLKIETVADIASAWVQGWTLLAPSRAAQCALDVALWDWLGKRRGLTASELAWGEPPRNVISFATIGLSTPEELPEKVAELTGFPRIKIKSDAHGDLAVVRAVREKSPAFLAVDANGAWLGHDLATLANALAEMDVGFIEQPLPPAEDTDFTGLALPVFADESCVTEDDVPRVLERFDGFNIKLVKCGGITPALRMVQRGRAAGRKIMVGCMLESSVLIAAGAVIAQRTDFADLDGAWLLGDDPFSGWPLERGILQASATPGLGVFPAADLFPDRNH